MTDALTAMLAERDWILADGATGTALFAAGLEAGGAPELWCEERPEEVRALHRGAIEAGSDLILTNSFGGTASRLKLHGADGRVRALARLAAALGREEASAAGRPVIVAGSMGPTGEILEPVGAMPATLAAEQFHEQAEGLREGGADVLWIETISAPEEYRAAAEGARLAGMPWAGTMSFDTAGRTMMGLTAGGLADLAASLDHPPVAFGANCGAGAADLVRTVLGFPETDRPVIAKGNAGIPRWVGGHVHYDGTPALMARYAALARDAGARVIGGCCGTGPEHLAAMRRALEETPPGPRPDLARVEEALGAFSSPGDGSEAPPPRARRRRRGG